MSDSTAAVAHLEGAMALHAFGRGCVVLQHVCRAEEHLGVGHDACTSALVVLSLRPSLLETGLHGLFL